MSNETVESLWRSLGNDGLAGLFESDSSSGVLATVLSALGKSESSSKSRLAADLSLSNVIGRHITQDALGGFSLIGGLLRTLIGSGEADPATPQPVRYNPPTPLRLNAGLIPTAVDGVSGVLPVHADSQSRQTSLPNIVVNVNALDSRSILDRSDDIASAVRQAMLTYQPFDDIWR